MYGTPTCPMVPPVRGMLNRAQAPFDYVNIAEDAAGKGKVMAINDGNASVPTLVFPDGSTLTEPSTAVLRDKLHSLGYKVPPPNLWQSLRELGVPLVVTMASAGAGGTTLAAAEAGQPDTLPEVPIDQDQPALLMYTSGTESRPKAVMHTSRSLFWNYVSTAVAGAMRRWLRARGA